MKTRIYPRPAIAALALLAVLTLSSCGGGGDDKADNASPPTSTAPAGSAAKPTASGSATTTASNPSAGGKSTTTSTTTTTEKLPGVAPKDNACSGDYPVKGKVTKKIGNIYHLPKTSGYEKVKPDTCFKDKAAAEAAGFHAPGAANK